MMDAGIRRKYEPHIGRRFGALRLLSFSQRPSDQNRIYGLFECDCGTRKEFPLSRMLKGYRSHCGCLTDRGAHRTHGMRGTAEYSSWQAMKGRCLDSGNKDYPRWGGRGITVCKEWIDSFEKFYRDVGPRPPGTTLDRIDNRKGYEPGNVRWATAREQQRNRRTSYRWFIRGLQFDTAADAAAYFGVSDQTIYRWAKGAVDARRGTYTPPRSDCYAKPRY